MNYSDEGFKLTRLSEGLRLTVYRDIVGLETIGFGHLVKPGEDFSAGITVAEAEAMLQADIANACDVVNREVTVPLTQGEFDALVDFVFNLGDRLRTSTLLKLLNAGQHQLAEQELAKWDYAGGKPNAALHARRVMEMALWEKGAQG